MRLFRPGLLAAWFYSEAIFRIKTTEKVLYLTFDDGPDPVSTPALLDILEKHEVKALFFCSGKAAERYPDLIYRIHDGGHRIGNHGYFHLNGWRTKSDEYVNDVIRASKFTSGKIFRPPFGRLSFKQKKMLLRSYRIFFWDVMPYDFDRTFGSRKTLVILKNKIRPGSIIVLHDTVSSCANLIVEEFIRYAVSEGYGFELMNDYE